MIPNIYTNQKKLFYAYWTCQCGHKTSNRYAIVLVVVLSLMILDGIIEAGSCSWILSKDIETYGIVKLLKRIGFYQE
jgi:hypothetical protein